MVAAPRGLLTGSVCREATNLYAHSAWAALPEGNTTCILTSKADLTGVSHGFHSTPCRVNLFQHTRVNYECAVLCTYCKCKQSTHGPLARAGLPALACLGSSASTSAAAHAKCLMPSSVPDSARLLDAHWTRDLHLVVPPAQQKPMRHYFLSCRKQHP